MLSAPHSAPMDSPRDGSTHGTAVTVVCAGHDAPSCNCTSISCVGSAMSEDHPLTDTDSCRTCRCPNLQCVDVIGLPCRNLSHLTLTRPSFSRASQKLTSHRTHNLSDAFDTMSFLHGNDLTHLAHGNASGAIPRHAHRCVQLHPARTGISRHVTSLLWKATPSTQRHSSWCLLRHQTDICTAFHWCRVNSSVTHDQSVWVRKDESHTTFTNEDLQTRALPH